MLNLPSEYKFLQNEQGPQILKEMLKIYGTIETPGASDNPVILSWAKELGLEKSYNHDAIPWCGLCAGISAKRAGVPLPKTPLWAKSWANVGTRVLKPGVGDIVVFVRDGGGHVGLCVGYDNEAIHCLGGNQSDKVCITRISKSRLFAIRRTDMRYGREIKFKINGTLSTNEG